MFSSTTIPEKALACPNKSLPFLNMSPLEVTSVETPQSAKIVVDDENQSPAQLKMPASGLKRSVHFADISHCVEVTHIDDMSDDLAAAIWFTDEELLAMRAENSRVARLMKTGFKIGINNEMSERGLEHQMPTEGQRRLKLKEEAKLAVLLEQEEQFETKTSDPEFIAESYQEYSQQAQALARTYGLQDKNDAKQIGLEAKSDNTPKSTQKSGCRSVKFRSNVKVRKIKHVSEIPEEIKLAIWYQAEDYNKMKRELKSTVKGFHYRLLKESVNCTLRGAEGYLPRNMKIKKNIRFMAYGDVLDEQESQIMLGIYDPERVRQVYVAISKESKTSANNRARDDEFFARSYTENERDKWENLKRKVSALLHKALDQPSFSSNTSKGTAKTKMSSIKSFAPKLSMKNTLGRVLRKT